MYLHSLILNTPLGLGEFSAVMQTVGLHNCPEFSQPLSCSYQAMQTRKTFSNDYLNIINVLPLPLPNPAPPNPENENESSSFFQALNMLGNPRFSVSSFQHTSNPCSEFPCRHSAWFPWKTSVCVTFYGSGGPACHWSSYDDSNLVSYLGFFSLSDVLFKSSVHY